MPRWIERTFVWAGGALFALSLALAVWLYASDFVHHAGDPSVGAAATDALLILVFAAHHSLFARPHMKRVVGQFVPERLIRSLYVWVASLLLIAVCLGWQPVGGVVYRAAGLWRTLLLLIQATGLVLIVGAVRAIRALELAGIEAPQPRTNDLQERGPYALVRHPLYLGWILAVGGAGHMTGDRLLFFVVTTLYILVAIPWEEAGLVGEFGHAYEAYRTRVPWRVLPYLY